MKVTIDFGYNDSIEQEMDPAVFAIMETKRFGTNFDLDGKTMSLRSAHLNFDTQADGTLLATGVIYAERIELAAKQSNMKKHYDAKAK